MSALVTAGAQGFSVTASNAVDLIAGTQAGSAGMISSNIRDMASTMHADLGRVSSQIATQTAQLSSVNAQGFKAVTDGLQKGFGNLQMLSGISIAVQAVGFAVVAKQLGALRGDVKAMHADMVRQGEELIALQRIANAGIERIVDFAERQLKTQEKILEALVSSRTVEAQQLIRQGWENLKNGYEADAFERFKRSLDYDNTVYVSHAELGRILEARSDLAGAEDHLIRAAKFASGSAPQIEGFALVQLAGFYDRRGRLDEALMRVRDALRREEAPSWRFYACEILARKGDGTEALKTLRGIISADGRFHAAAAGSESLQSLQPKLTELLIDIDAQRRAAALSALEQLTPVVRALDALGADARTLEVVRANGAAILEQILLRPFVDLEPLGERALETVQQATQRVDETCAQAVAGLHQVHAAIADQLARLPQQKEPIQVEAVMAKVKLIGFMVVAAIAGICGVSAVLENPDDPNIGYVALCIAAIAFAVGLYFRAQRASILRSHQLALAPLISQWNAWEASAAGATAHFEASKAQLAARLGSALQQVRSGRLEAAVAHVWSFPTPRTIARPAWTR